MLHPFKVIQVHSIALFLFIYITISDNKKEFLEEVVADIISQTRFPITGSPQHRLRLVRASVLYAPSYAVKDETDNPLQEEQNSCRSGR